jgi:hypothetical protein
MQSGPIATLDLEGRTPEDLHGVFDRAVRDLDPDLALALGVVLHCALATMLGVVEASLVPATALAILAAVAGGVALYFLIGTAVAAIGMPVAAAVVALRCGSPRA